MPASILDRGLSRLGLIRKSRVPPVPGDGIRFALGELDLSAMAKQGGLFPELGFFEPPAGLRDGRLAGLPKGIVTDWLFRPAYGQPRNIDVIELRTVTQSYWVRVCMNTIMDVATSTAWNIVPKHPDRSPGPEFERECLLEFFHDPNANKENFNSIRRQYIHDILEADSGTLELVYNEPGTNLLEIYARDGISFLKDIDQHGRLLGYWQYSFYGVGRKPVWFEPREVVYISRYPRSFNPYGFSPAQAILDIVRYLIYTTRYHARFAEEGAIPHGFMIFPGATEEEMKRMRNEWRQAMAGKQWKTPMFGSPMGTEPKWIQMMVSNKDMQILDQQQWFARLVQSIFNVTPSELGFTENINRATSEEQAAIFFRKGLFPLLQLEMYHINREIVPHIAPSGAWEFQFDFQEVEKWFLKPEDRSLTRDIVRDIRQKAARGEYGPGSRGSSLDEKIVQAIEGIEDLNDRMDVPAKPRVGQ